MTDLKVLIEEYLSNNYDETSIKFIDNEKVIFQYSNSITLRLDIKELLKDDFKSYLDRTLEIEDVEDHFYHTKLNFSDKNPKLKISEGVGFKFGGYAEYLFEYGSATYYKTFKLDEFDIGNSKVCISKPSDIFRMLFADLEGDDYLGDWNSWYSIKLNNINASNYKNILQQALFYFAISNPTDYPNEYPSIFHFSEGYEGSGSYDDDEKEENVELFETEIEKGHFIEMNYVEAVGFYNSAMQASSKNDEVAFLYYYKVLEYFFLFNYKNEIRSKITEYNTDNNIDKFIGEITTIYRNTEDSLLSYLLSSCATELIDIIAFAKSNDLIMDHTLEDLSAQIYQYRNSIVHGKSDVKYSLKIPDNIDNSLERLWNHVIRRIAFILIKKNCLGK